LKKLFRKIVFFYMNMSNNRYIWHRSPSYPTMLQSLPACIIMIKRETKDSSSNSFEKKCCDIAKNVPRNSSLKIKRRKRRCKKCPKCDWLNPLGNHICEAGKCDHEFAMKLTKSKKRVVKVKNPSGRRGYKRCPKCDALVPIRRHMCQKNECEYMFQ